jgi:pantothenate synthetase
VAGVAGIVEFLDEERPALLSLAAYFGTTRLIDNIILAPARRATGQLVMP